MSKSFLTACPRCGSGSYEHLSTHSHCIECLYFNCQSGSTAHQPLNIQEVEKILTYLDNKKKVNLKSEDCEAV